MITDVYVSNCSQEKDDDSDFEPQAKSQPSASIPQQKKPTSGGGGLFSSTDSDNEGDDLFGEPKAKPAATPEIKKKVSVDQ